MDDDFEEPEHMIVGAINNPLSSEQYEDLCATINLLSPSSLWYRLVLGCNIIRHKL